VGEKPDYRKLMGLGESLLSERVGEAEFSLRRKESAGLVNYPVPMGSLCFTVVDSNGSGGGMVGRPWGGIIMGDQRVICGDMPSKAATAETTVERSEPVLVRVALGAWLVVAPRARKVAVTFRDSEGKVVKKFRIRPWLALRDRAGLRSDWTEDPTYVPTRRREGSEKDSENHPWGERIKRYGLGEALVTVPALNGQASLYCQRHTGRIWHTITGVGGTFGPIRDDFEWGGARFGGEQVIHGLLPPTTVTAKAVMSGGQTIPVHTVPGAFLVVAPSSEDMKVTFMNSRGKTVWTHRIPTEGRRLVPGFWDIVRIYWLGLRVLLWRLRQRRALGRQ
jgi:hypothetical protein